MNQRAVQQTSRSSTSAIPTEIRRVEGREWWLWGFAIVITLALTLGIISFTFPRFHWQQDAAYWFDLREWVRGLAALVLLFDVYAIYQHLQLQRVRHQLAEQHALRQAEEKYRAIFEDAVVGIFQITPEGRPLSINRALAQMHGYDSPEHAVRGGLERGTSAICRSERMVNWHAPGREGRGSRRRGRSLPQRPHEKMAADESAGRA